MVIGASLATFSPHALAVSEADQGVFQQAVDLYDLGRYKEAYDIWLRLAQDKGDPDAMRNVGQILRLGLGVDKQPETAFLWYNRAAEAGLTSAQVVTAIMLLRGEGTEKDQLQASEWFRKAAESNDATAQYNLALMYEHGLGIGKDLAVSQSWYEKAADNGHEGAAKRLALVQNKLGEQTVGTSNMTGSDSNVSSTWTAPGSKTKTVGDSDTGNSQSVESDETPETENSPRTAIIEQTVETTTNTVAEQLSEEESTETTFVPLQKRTTEYVDENKNFSNKAETAVAKNDPVKSDEATEGMASNANTAEPVVAKKSEEEPAAKTEISKVDEDQKVTKVETETIRVTQPETKKVDEEESAVKAIVKKTKRIISPTDTALAKAEKSYRAGNYSEARNIWIGLAEKDVAQAQFWLGRLYNRGEGVALDRQKAYTLWKKASESGYAPATTALVNLVSRFGQNQSFDGRQQDTLLRN